MRWETVRLGAIVDIKVGKTPPRAEPKFWGPGYPWLSIKDMNQGTDLHHTKEEITELAVATTHPFLVPSGTVLLSFKLSVGKVGVTSRPLYTNEAIAALVPRQTGTLDERYLLRALQFIDLAHAGNDAVLGAVLNRGALEAIRIPLPSLPEQRRIAAILDEADSLRVRAEASLASIGSLEDAFVAEALTKSTARATLASLGVTLSAGLSVGDGGLDGHPVNRILKVSAVSRGVFDAAETKPMPDSYSPPKAHMVEPGSLLMTRASGSVDLIARSTFVPAVPADVYLPDKIWRVEVAPHSPVSLQFVNGLTRDPDFRAYVRNASSGASGVRNISQSKVLAYSAPIPSPDALANLHVGLAQAATHRALAKTRRADTIALFASLQHRAFRGEL